MNDELIKNFIILHRHFQKIKETWRANSYKKIVSILLEFNEEITDIKQVKNIPGIGKSSILKIREFLDTGEISQVLEIKKQQKTLFYDINKDRTIKDFIKVWGIGPVKAEDLWNKNIKNISQLKENKNLLTKNQKIGLEYYEHLQKRIPRKYIDILKICMIYILNKELGKDTYKLEVAGSYRRHKIESGDMDCLISSDNFNLNDIVRVLKKWKLIKETLVQKNVKFMGISQCPSGKWFPIRLDIQFVNKKYWESSLLYFTGSKKNNLEMRNKAINKGWKLNEYGLYKDSKRLPYNTEKEIYKALGMKYLKPENR